MPSLKNAGRVNAVCGDEDADDAELLSWLDMALEVALELEPALDSELLTLLTDELPELDKLDTDDVAETALLAPAPELVPPPEHPASSRIRNPAPLTRARTNRILIPQLF